MRTEREVSTSENSIFEASLALYARVGQPGATSIVLLEDLNSVITL
jgi:hypothetical protein